ncbi:calcium-dependent phosphotriesterase [Coniochaeta sp. PMI_546]|nr:calcium-dependent phosphotriesterase [Coniochaeta sp. PMI_546]
MPGVIISRVGLAAVVALAIITQVLPAWDFVTLLKLGYGLGKDIQPVSDFPYQCRRIDHPLLQACEDMWLSERSRKLYLACSDPYARTQWFPSVDHYNLSGRSQKDAIVVLDIDQPGILAASELITVQKLEAPNYRGTVDDGFLDLNGFTGIHMDNGVVRLLVANNRPSIDPSTGTYAADQAKAGANATVEVFESKEDNRRGSIQVLTHILTVASPNISTPNRVAAFRKEGFYITNDHGKVKSGGLARLRAMLGKGDVTFCSYENECSIVSSGHYYPNGLLLHSDGRLYVPSSAAGGINVYQPHRNGSLQKVGEIDAFYAIDNLSEDSNGDIFAAVFPLGVKNQAYVKSPFGPVPASTVLRIYKTQDSQSGYQWEKVLEDRDGEVLPAATVVVHDASTGRLFFSGASSPFITVCNPKKP